MTFLAMDTATDTLSIAIGRGDDILSCAAAHIARGHSRLLQPVVQQVMDTAGVKASALDALCVGIGPGSYTGVRLAVSTAKAMALALGVPLYTASTLLAAAEAAEPGDGQRQPWVLPLLWARRGRAFGALYRKGANGRWSEVDPPQVRPLDSWLPLWRSRERRGGSRTVIHDFSGLRERPPEMKDWLGTGGLAADAARVIDLSVLAPDLAAALIRLADSGQARRVEGDAVHAVAPEYVLPVAAEVNLGERGGRT